MISGNWLLKILLLGPVLMITEASFANEGKPAQVSILKKDVETVIPISDSIPQNKTVPENTTVNKRTSVIKEVPKSKKQVVPISVSPTVKTIKPIRVIKPKIIKPVIKIN
jgi:transcription-repair coupling factor (superfamily II helicase)